MSDPLHPNLLALRTHLLRIGGERWSNDDFVRGEIHPDLAALLLHAPVCAGGAARLRRGRPNSCHQNSFDLAQRYASYQLMTGMALSGDGIWRPHSWCLDARGEVVETTVLRTHYLGVPAELDPAFDPLDYL